MNTWPNDVANLNIAFGRIAKPSATLTSQPSLCPLSQETLHKWEKTAKETSYICNKFCCFNLYIMKIQGSVHYQLKILLAELGQGKSSTRAQTASNEQQHLTSFNQNVSFQWAPSALISFHICANGQPPSGG